MPSISIYKGDITNRVCDAMILKHADGFFGVDEIIANLVGFGASVAKGDARIVPGRGTEAARIAFIGVGPLSDFEYGEIREFGREALRLTKRRIANAKRICMPIHGPGYGLDEAEAFSSLIAGIVDAFKDRAYPARLEGVEIVEINPQRARRCRMILDELLPGSTSIRSKTHLVETAVIASAQERLKPFGPASKKKTQLFVAMPFAVEFDDEWNAIQEATHPNGILPRRIDQSSFVGDIATELKRRIEDYDGLIGLLSGANPNVFLEIGYAWARGKPTILLAKKGQELPFDVRGQRCLVYAGIYDLREKLRLEIAQLKTDGVFGRSYNK